MAKPKKPPPEKTPEQEAAEAVQVSSLAEAMQDYEVFVQARAAGIWQYSEIPVPLKLEEQLFARSYVIDRNEIAALRRLGYTDHDQPKLKAIAKKYLAKAEVQEAIEYLAREIMERLEITADKVNQVFASVAFFDPREIMLFDKYGIDLLPSRFWRGDQAAAIQSIKMGQHGLELKFYDRMKGAEMLAKQLGQLPDDGNSRAEEARIAADEAMAKIGSIIDRLIPTNKPFEQRVRDKQKQLAAPGAE